MRPGEHKTVQARILGYAEAEGALLGQFRHLHADIYGNREFVGHLRNRGKFFDHEEKHERDLRQKATFAIAAQVDDRDKVVHIADELFGVLDQAQRAQAISTQLISQAETKREFKARVHSWAETLGAKINWLGVRDMKNKWASCSTKGNLNLNSELLGLDHELQDYVIVHELLHFSVPNHGKLWKSLMTAHLGNYQELERRLGAQHQ